MGDSERMLNEIAERAQLIPWETCFLLVDEIDSMVPDRTSDSGKNKDSGEANDEVQAEANFEELISVNYNYVYLLEILSHISSEKVLICLKDERTPALIKDEKLDSYFYILMPMRF